MMSDQPRVEYIDPDKITKEDLEDAKKRGEAARERVKKRGLGISLGNKGDLKGFVGNTIMGAK